METKTKIRVALGARIKKYTKYQQALLVFFLAAFLFFSSECRADDAPIITAVQIKGIHANDDFIEIYNPSCADKDVSGWKLRKIISSGTESSIKVLSDNTVIHAKSYFLWSNSDFADAVGADQSTGATLSENYSIALIDDDKIIDSITWGTNAHAFVGTHTYPVNPVASQALKKDAQDNFALELNYSPKNSKFTNSAELELCPKKEPDPTLVSKTYSKDINITELFPSPFKSVYEEYIELYNAGDEDVDLSGWQLHDASKTGKYVFPSGVFIKIKEYLAVFKKDFKFALNNSGHESVTLLSPDGKEVSNMSYDGSKRNLSYGFDGGVWRWSKFLTPGLPNISNNIPQEKDKIPQKAYADVWTEFFVKTKDKDHDKVKVVWDFGDGHKSYLAETRHKYEKLGVYAASLKISDGIEDVIKKFNVRVKKFPHPKVRIKEINANPAGKDSDFETLTVKNDSKKDINFKNWSVATGVKNLYNHPIIEDLEVKKGKEVEITREFSKFALNNKQGKIELRYPDGKAADKVKYGKEDGIKEGEIYSKAGKGWTWKAGMQKAEVIDNQPLVIEKTEDISDMKVGMQTKLETTNALELENNINVGLLNMTPSVLGTETVRQENGQYFFTPQMSEHPHYAVLFLGNIFSDMNFGLNTLLNYFFK